MGVNNIYAPSWGGVLRYKNEKKAWSDLELCRSWCSSYAEDVIQAANIRHVV